MGYMCYNGEGEEPDKEMGVEALFKAKEKGQPEAEEYLKELGIKELKEKDRKIFDWEKRY